MNCKNCGSTGVIYAMCSNCNGCGVVGYICWKKICPRRCIDGLNAMVCNKCPKKKYHSYRYQQSLEYLTSDDLESQTGFVILDRSYASIRGPSGSYKK